MVRRNVQLTTIVLAATLAVPAHGSAAAAATRLRVDGIGPLRLGMGRVAAVRTGWLVQRGKGCPLGGTPPITYRFGNKAPAALRGGVEFAGGRLVDLSVTRGVRTAEGVTVGTTVAQMVRRYRAAGLKARSAYSATFQGTFVTVKDDGRQVVGAFATRGRITTLALPNVPVCE